MKAVAEVYSPARFPARSHRMHCSRSSESLLGNEFQHFHNPSSFDQDTYRPPFNPSVPHPGPQIVICSTLGKGCSPLDHSSSYLSKADLTLLHHIETHQTNALCSGARHCAKRTRFGDTNISNSASWKNKARDSCLIWRQVDVAPKFRWLEEIARLPARGKTRMRRPRKM
jgi:hypothetical protein